MNRKERSEPTDPELLEEAKKRKASSILHAGLIGFMVGIVIYSAVKNTWGLLTLIPLYFIYRLLKKPKK
ncbi:MAG: FUSC family protein [Haliscomenobacter sp.]|jgi:hypothetical protein|nr:FUSC family protein [Haliscomenobacter sp.]